MTRELLDAAQDRATRAFAVALDGGDDVLLEAREVRRRGASPSARRARRTRSGSADAARCSPRRRLSARSDAASCVDASARIAAEAAAAHRGDRRPRGSGPGPRCDRTRRARRARRRRARVRRARRPRGSAWSRLCCAPAAMICWRSRTIGRDDDRRARASRGVAARLRRSKLPSAPPMPARELARAERLAVLRLRACHPPPPRRRRRRRRRRPPPSPASRASPCGCAGHGADASASARRRGSADRRPLRRRRARRRSRRDPRGARRRRRLRSSSSSSPSKSALDDVGASATRPIDFGRLRLDFERLDVRVVLGLAVVARGLAALLPPLAEREHAGLHPDDRVGLVFFLEQRGEARAHRHLGALAHVREKVLLDRELGDLFVVQRFAGEAQHLCSGFGERHVSISPGTLPRKWPDAIAREASAGLGPVPAYARSEKSTALVSPGANAHSDADRHSSRSGRRQTACCKRQALAVLARAWTTKSAATSLGRSLGRDHAAVAWAVSYAFDAAARRAAARARCARGDVRRAHGGRDRRLRVDDEGRLKRVARPALAATSRRAVLRRARGLRARVRVREAHSRMHASPRAAWMARLYLQLGDSEAAARAPGVGRRGHRARRDDGRDRVARLGEVAPRAASSAVASVGSPPRASTRSRTCRRSGRSSDSTIGNESGRAHRGARRGPRLERAGARLRDRLTPSIVSHGLFDWAVLMMFRLWGPSVLSVTSS